MKLIIFLTVLLMCLPAPVYAVDIERVVRVIEAEIRWSPVEIAVCIHPESGVVLLRVAGDADSVQFKRAQMRTCMGSILTHNHVRGGAVFSIPDVQLAEWMNLRQLRATGRDERGRAETCIATRPERKIAYGFGLLTPLPGSAGGMWRAIEDLFAQYGQRGGWAYFFSTQGFDFKCETALK